LKAIPIKKNNSWKALFLCAFLFAALYISFYPPIHGIEDEIGFVNQALLWSQGSLTLEGAGLNTDQMGDFVFSDGNHISLRNPGLSLLLFPFLLLFGTGSVFFVSLLIHLSSTFVLAAFLSKEGKNPLWSLLLLLHPTFVIYSRTVMSDQLAGLFIFLSLLSIGLKKSPGFWAGCFAGFAVLTRYQAGIILPLALLGLLLNRELENKTRAIWQFLFSGGIMAASIITYNLYLYGFPFPLQTFSDRFVWSHFPEKFPIYFSGLMFLWPGMFLAIFAKQKERWKIILPLACLIYLLFFSFYYHHDSRSSYWTTLIIGQRFMQIILPVWIFLGIGLYLRLLDVRVVSNFTDRLAKPIRLAAPAVCILLLFILNTMVIKTHQEHLLAFESAKEEVKEKIPVSATIIANVTLRKLFGVYDPENPSYHWLNIGWLGHVTDPSSLLKGTLDNTSPVYLAVLARLNPSEVSEFINPYQDHYNILRIPSESPRLALFRLLPLDPPK